MKRLIISDSAPFVESVMPHEQPEGILAVPAVRSVFKNQGTSADSVSWGSRSPRCRPDRAEVLIRCGDVHHPPWPSGSLGLASSAAPRIRLAPEFGCCTMIM